MIAFLARLLLRREAVLTDATPRDAQPIAALHAKCFQRGWSDGEVEKLLIEPNVVADVAVVRRGLVGFILTRTAADEADVLSIGVARAERGKGLGRRLLLRNLQRLVGMGIRVAFLEVDADNRPALALYRRIGFTEVGRRERYYGGAAGAPAALVLRRDLT